MAVKDGLGPAGRCLIIIIVIIIIVIVLVIIIIIIMMRVSVIKNTFITIFCRLLQLVVPQNTRGLCR